MSAISIIGSRITGSHIAEELVKDYQIVILDNYHSPTSNNYCK